MTSRRALSFVALAVAPVHIACDRSATAQVCGGNNGPDVVVADLISIGNYTAVDGIDAFSIADIACNVGTQNAQFIPNTNQHPVMAQNLYRYKVTGGAGRFEQVGMGWLKHDIVAVVTNVCCSCNGQGATVLGVGCSNPNTAGFNGNQCTTTGGLGPRFQINAHTGAFAFPYAFRNDCASVPHTSITRRLQVATADIDPTLNFGSSYFGELQYVTADDASSGNQDNNASYRRVMMSGAGPNINATVTETVQRTMPAIRAWQAIDPLVQLTDISTPEALAGDTTGFGILGSRVTDLGRGQHRYEYAVYNMNSDRSFASFAVPSAPGLVVTNIGFHDVNYHSGDGFDSAPGAVTTFDGTDWPGSNDGAAIAWTFVPAVPVENSNALRWGTLYNFRFDCNVAPVAGLATIGLFKPVAGLPDAMTVATQVPGPLPICEADITGNSTVNVEDLLAVIGAWGPCANPRDCAADIAPAPSGDDIVNVQDLLAVIGAWGACP